jgi:hypothetical protein
VNRSQRLSKQQKRAMELEEHARFHHVPSKWRHPTTGKRVPEPVVRTIDTMCKGRWQGKRVRRYVVEDVAIFYFYIFFVVIAFE